jgi:hypothetical protein
MIDLGSMTDKFFEDGQKVVRRAIEVSRSSNHNSLSLSHIFAALSELESALFAETMQSIHVDPDSVIRLLEQELSETPQYSGRKMAIPEMTRDLFNRALRRARAQGRQQIESYDLFAKLFTDQNGAPAELLRRLGVDPARAIVASGAISHRARRREEQTESLRDRAKSRAMRIFKISRLTAGFFNSTVTIMEKGVTPSLWDTTDVGLTEQERQRVEAVASSLLNKSVVQMNEATIWSRAIYPLLVLAEQGELEAWAQSPLKAQYPGFGLEGIADGVIGHNISGLTKSFCLVVQVKRVPEARDPLIRLYGAMLAAASLNWERDNRVPQEIFGCYTIADNWTFIRGLVSDIEASRPTMTVASSREYSVKVEAETIVRILKFITGKFAQGAADPA